MLKKRDSTELTKREPSGWVKWHLRKKCKRGERIVLSSEALPDQTQGKSNSKYSRKKGKRWRGWKRLRVLRECERERGKKEEGQKQMRSMNTDQLGCERILQQLLSVTRPVCVCMWSLFFSMMCFALNWSNYPTKICFFILYSVCLAKIHTQSLPFKPTDSTYTPTHFPCCHWLPGSALAKRWQVFTVHQRIYFIICCKIMTATSSSNTKRIVLLIIFV